MNGLLFSLVVVGLAPALAGEDFDATLVDGRLTETKAVAQGPLQDILSGARGSRGSFDRLADLCDNIGARLAGSEELEAAVEWSVGQLTEAGADKVWTEPVMVPHWVRGAESAQMLSPRNQQLNILGLGGTVAGVVEGDVVVLGGLEEVDDSVKGKIVLFDSPMGDSIPTVHEYGGAVSVRVHGPSAAAAHGAVAVMVRSVTTRSLNTPHTGATVYKDDVPKIPAVAVTTEDSASMARLIRAGTSVRVKIETSGVTHDDAPSHNVVGEIRGAKKPREVVLIGAHLDSWDVGQGAHDDGAGVVEVIEALSVIRSLGVQPKRTIRVVLFTNEENGLAGGKAYAVAHPPRFRERHVAAIESDLGGGAPRFWTAQGTDKQMTWLRKAAAPLGMPVGVGGGGADIRPLGEQGVLRIGFRPDDTHYFDVHHTAADTLDKVDPIALAESTAAIAGLAWQLANVD